MIRINKIKALPVIVGIIFLNCMTIAGEEIDVKKIWNLNNFEYETVDYYNPDTGAKMSNGIKIKSIPLEIWEEKVIEIPDSVYTRSWANSESYHGYPVVSLQHSLFRDHPVVEKIILPAGVTVIPEICFQNCKALREVECKNIRTIEKRAFDGCVSLKKIGDDADINGGVLNFRSGCSYIGMEAFRGTQIKEVNISESVSPSSPLKLANKAFSGMKELKKVSINQECQVLGFTLEPEESCSAMSLPFGENEALEEVKFSKEFQWVYDWKMLYDADGPNKNVGKRLPVKACCDSLKKQLSLPSLKKVILEGECKSLVPVFAPDFELKILSDSILTRPLYYKERYLAWESTHGSWEYAERLFSNDVLNWLFSCSAGVKSLVLGENVTNLSGTLFESLEKVTVLSSTPPPCGNSFPDEVYSNAMLIVPEGGESAYSQADGWKKFRFINGTSVEEVSSGEISAPEYYDLMGRRVLNPEKGIYIVRDSHGTRKVIL